MGGGRKAYRVAGKPPRVRGEGGSHKDYGVAENPRGDCQGVGGEVELPQGINAPGVEELPRGDETPGMASEGEGAMEGERQGWKRDGNPPAPEQARRAEPTAETRT